MHIFLRSENYNIQREREEDSTYWDIAKKTNYIYKLKGEEPDQLMQEGWLNLIMCLSMIWLAGYVLSL